MSAPARYVASCSCGKWRQEGTAVELSPLIRRHDDSPWRHHIVSLDPFGPATDADFKAAHEAEILAMHRAHPEWFPEFEDVP